MKTNLISWLALAVSIVALMIALTERRAGREREAELMRQQSEALDNEQAVKDLKMDLYLKKQIASPH